MPPKKISGANTAISDRLIETTVKPTSLAPRIAASQSRHALFEIARDVLEHDDRVVDDEAGRDRQRHQRQVVEAEAEQIHHAERADDRGRHRDARDRRGAHAAQEGEHDQDHQHDRDRSASSRCRPATGGWSSSGRRRRSDRRRPAARRSGAAARRARRRRLDDVRAGLARQDDSDARLAVDEAGVAQVLDRIDDLGDVGQPDRARRCDRRSRGRDIAPPSSPGRWRRSDSGRCRPRSRPSGCWRWRRRARRGCPRGRCRSGRSRPD